MTALGPWTFRALDRPDELGAAPPTMSPEQAQAWCNFVLWTPGRLPAGCGTAPGSMRREAPPGRTTGHEAGFTPWSENNPASYRLEIGGDGRRLRLKQFLYDWAFPALDHPCLWGNPTRARTLPGDGVLWLGTDYESRPGASARLARTTIELSVLAGEFGDDELADLYAGLRPADEAAADLVGATPFAALNYWARRPEAKPVLVPVGLFTFRRARSARPEWAAGDRARQWVTGAGLPVTLGGLELDSAARFADADGARDLEVLYAGGARRGAELRLVAQAPGEGTLQVPAEPDVHPGTRTQVNGVQLAWEDERFGPWQAVLADPGTGLEATLLASTGVALDRDWFLGAVAELRRSAGTSART